MSLEYEPQSHDALDQVQCIIEDAYYRHIAELRAGQILAEVAIEGMSRYLQEPDDVLADVADVMRETNMRAKYREQFVPLQQTDPIAQAQEMRAQWSLLAALAALHEQNYATYTGKPAKKPLPKTEAKPSPGPVTDTPPPQSYNPEDTAKKNSFDPRPPLAKRRKI